MQARKRRHRSSSQQIPLIHLSQSRVGHLDKKQIAFEPYCKQVHIFQIAQKRKGRNEIVKNEAQKTPEETIVEAANLLAARYYTEINDFNEDQKKELFVSLFNATQITPCAKIASSLSIAKTFLGRCYYRGIGTAPDKEKAIKIWTKEAKKNKLPSGTFF